MTYQKNLNPDQVIKNLYSPQSEANRIFQSDPANKFLAVASAAGITLDVAKKLFSLWKKQDLDPDWNEVKDVYHNDFDATYKSSLNYGLPIFDRYIELKVSPERSLTDVEDSLLLEIVFITAKRKPITINTVIPGKEYTIKEKLSGGDYDITLKGSIVSKNPYQFPNDEVKLMNDILSTDNLIDINSRYLNEVIGVLQVITKDFTLKEDSKFSNMANFEIHLLSDEIEGILI